MHMTCTKVYKSDVLTDSFEYVKKNAQDFAC